MYNRGCSHYWRTDNKSVRELRRQGAIVEDVICVIQREKKATVC